MTVQYAKLNIAEVNEHAAIMNSTKEQFAERILAADDNEYVRLVNFIRKLKIIHFPLPEWLGNITSTEWPLAERAEQAARVGKLFSLVGQLDKAQEQELAMIHFRGHVQYL